MILGIYGAGGLGREFLDLAAAIHETQYRWTGYIFLDDNAAFSELHGLPVLRFDNAITSYSPSDLEIVIGIGEPFVRKSLRERVSGAGFSLPALVHPTAVVGTRNVIGAGVIIRSHTFVSCDVIIGQNTLVQNNAIVGHDAFIGEDSVVSSVVTVNGGCRVGSCVYIGPNTCLREKVSIGSGSIVSMGSAVHRDVPENVIVMGNPARIILKNESLRVFQ